MQNSEENQSPETKSVAPEPGAPAGPESTMAAADPAPPPSLEEQLRKAEALAAERQDAWLRAKAEGDNIRKRAQIDVQNAQKFGIESFAEALLPVKDSLDAALAAQNNTVESLRGGVELTLKQLVSAFEKFKLAEIDPTGQKFDPHRHQAMSMVESEAEPNTVVQVFQKGYALHDRVLRPALVSVARGKAA